MKVIRSVKAEGAKKCENVKLRWTITTVFRDGINSGYTSSKKQE